MEYHYVTVETKRVNDVLANFAANGYTVHTINRNPNAQIVDILFEKAPKVTFTPVEPQYVGTVPRD